MAIKKISMKRGFDCNTLIIIVLLFGWVNLTVSAQTKSDEQDDPNVKVFMSYLQKNWDDIHDVIMRFHKDDPALKGTAVISMNWQNGILISASVANNTTGNPDFGLALIAAMRKWIISGLTESWISAIPIKTVIYGSENPAFSNCGILTGNVTDESGNPVYRAELILTLGESLNAKADTNYTNREGVFIWTLIPVGGWKLECIKDGYLPSVIDKLTFEKGKHLKRVIILKNRL